MIWIFFLFHKGCTDLYSHQPCTVFLFSGQCFSYYFDNSHSDRCGVVSSCGLISFLWWLWCWASFSSHLLTIWVSLEECLFRFLLFLVLFLKLLKILAAWLFVVACGFPLLQGKAFLSWSKDFSSCAMRAPELHRLCGTQALPQVAVCGLLSRDMWDLGSLTRDWTYVPCIGKQILNHGTTREVPLALLKIRSFVILLELFEFLVSFGY